MLEIKNLTKIYKTKGGVDTIALDNVSVTFEEKGMVFLLGKSGSGKSTLLNLCGGLDTPTKGEIIVRGRSSATFSGSDFDSYRNTFVGFIFQEYNVLNEFTVEENLSIALELQGKPKDKAKVDELLRRVDMQGFKKRKPNTLSGGQKQRIAIARALIKDPRIIMADEPTGALDSATGKQVFDTLKSLSEDRLVIVVSHDRDFAEYYGDRIIELKDGKIISDVTKERSPEKALTGNVAVIGENTLSVKNGKALGESDFKSIKEFLFHAEEDVIITRGKKSVDDFKKANRIAEDGSSEYFQDTDTENIKVKTYTKEERKFVRSRLPLKKAVKIGVSNLKIKPFRLFFTILLSVIAFIMFGVSSTLMAYDENRVLKESFAQSTYNAVALGKGYHVKHISYENGEERYSYDNYNNTVMTEEDVISLSSAMDADLLPYFDFNSRYGGKIYVNNISDKKGSPKTMTDYSVTGFAPASEASAVAPVVLGEYPSSAGEVAISSFFADCILKNELKGLNEDGSPDNVSVPVADINGLIGKKISFRVSNTTVVVTIKGIFDGGETPSKFSGYDRVETVETWDTVMLMEYAQFISETMQKIFLVSDDFYSTVADKIGYEYSEENDYEKYFEYGKSLVYQKNGNERYISSWCAYDSAQERLTVYFFDPSKNSVTGDDMVLCLNDMPSVAIEETAKQNWIDAHESEYLQKSEDARRLADEHSGSEDPEDKRLLYYYNGLRDIYYNVAKEPDNLIWNLSYALQDINYGEFYISFPDDVKAELIAILKDYFTECYTREDLSVQLKNNESGNVIYGEIVGFYLNPSNSNKDYNTGAYVSEEKYPEFQYESAWRDEIVTKYVLQPSAVYYSGVFVPFGNEQKDNMDKILSIIGKTAEDDSFYYIDNSLYQSVSMISGTVKSMEKVFLYIGIAIAMFASLLLFNFISVSITNKMHEIGVLRAVGARGADVFKIFFSESFVISVICLIISALGTLGLLSYLNAEITQALSFSMQLLVFGPLSLVMLVGVAIAVALLGTLIPVVRISSKKPVDSMRSL